MVYESLSLSTDVKNHSSVSSSSLLIIDFSPFGSHFSDFQHFPFLSLVQIHGLWFWCFSSLWSLGPQKRRKSARARKEETGNLISPSSFFPFVWCDCKIICCNPQKSSICGGEWECFLRESNFPGCSFIFWGQSIFRNFCGKQVQD